MRAGSRIAGFRFHPLPFLSLPLPRFVRTESCSVKSPQDSLLLKKDNIEFLPWLQQKAGQEISSVLSIGSSIYGRSLFTTRPIRAGECVLKVPFSVHVTPDDMPSEVKPLIGSNVGSIAQVAVTLLAERRRCQDSEWAPYINSLPHVDDMHCLLIDSLSIVSNGTQQPCRRQMARDLLTGELRVLESACSWLANYCSN